MFESTLLSEFWVPQEVTYDQAFDLELFVAFLDKYGNGKRPIAPRRHNKNVIKSKHRVIRDEYFCLKRASTEDDPAVQQALRITNNL